MQARWWCGERTISLISSLLLVVFGVTAAISPGWTAQSEIESLPSAEVEESEPPEPHMSEDLRSTIDNVVVIAGQVPSKDELTGSYDKDTAGLIGGMDEGSQIGTISKEIGGVPVNIPIPVLGTLGTIWGGLSGVTKRELQEFRDALTEELVNADSPALRSDGLAQDAYWGIQRLPAIDSHVFGPSTPIPEDTDAVLYVNFDGLTIDVQGGDAVITTAATATLRRLSDGTDVYETVVRYQDRDSLSNWTDDDNALWHQYTNFARYYLGSEIAADVFSKVELQDELRPIETDTADQDRKNKLKFVSESLTPTLAWELKQYGGSSYALWTENIDESAISYDIEIFDNRQLVYYEKQVPDPSHTLTYELEPCMKYRWSVRPVYQVGTDIRFGEWMRFSPESDEENQTESEKGLFGREASESPAYIQDFAFLETEC